MARLEGKVAFITGAGSGIARSASQIFTQEGAKVVIAELKPDLGQAAEKLVREAGGDATFIETDVTKEDSVQNAIQQTVERYGKLDVLYNCAGGSVIEDTKVTEVNMEVWQHTQSLDLLGTFLCCRHGIPELIKAGGGAVVNMSSVVALRGSFSCSRQRRHYLVNQGHGRRICPKWHSGECDLPRRGDDRSGQAALW